MEMTTGTLALIIAAALLTQIAMGVTVALYRRRRQCLDDGAQETAVQVLPKLASPTVGEGAWQGFKPFRVARRVQENDAGDVVSFYLEPETPMLLPAFKPGQFLTFQFDLEAKGERQKQRLVRCYSISDRPREDAYRISVKREPEGVVSNHLHERVREGDRLMVKAPSGPFHLREDSRLPLVLIAGGIGVTPMLSILLTLLSQGSEREIWLFYGVRNGREVILHDRLRGLAEFHQRFHLHLCYSRPDPADRPGVDFSHAGRVDIPLLQRELSFARYQFYVCGPAAMMESIVPGLDALGVAKEDIHYEAFGPASLSRPEKPAESAGTGSIESWTVGFGNSGRSAEWRGEHDSLLSFAEAEGIAVDSACRAGVCGGCQTRIEKGEVVYNQEPEAEVEAGHCLLCVSRPKGDLSLAL